MEDLVWLPTKNMPTFAFIKPANIFYCINAIFWTKGKILFCALVLRLIPLSIVLSRIIILLITILLKVQEPSWIREMCVCVCHSFSFWRTVSIICLLDRNINSVWLLTWLKWSTFTTRSIYLCTTQSSNISLLSSQSCMLPPDTSNHMKEHVKNEILMNMRNAFKLEYINKYWGVLFNWRTKLKIHFICSLSFHLQTYVVVFIDHVCFTKFHYGIEYKLSLYPLFSKSNT